jgi:hypothetical protein
MGYGLLPPIPLTLNPALYRSRSASELLRMQKTKLPCLATVCSGKPDVLLYYLFLLRLNEDNY